MRDEEISAARRKHLYELAGLPEEKLGDLQWEMYREGLWTGKLNALDERSPHVVNTLGEVEFWYHDSIAYLEWWMNEHGID